MVVAMPDREDPTVIRLLRQYRLALIGREDEQTKRLAKSWLLIENSLRDDMTLLALQINEAKATGSVITEQLLLRMSRYQKLNNQMKTEILKYVKDVAIPDIEKEQLAFGTLGIQSASEAIQVSAALGAAFDRLPVDAVETFVGFLGDGTPLYRLLKEAYPDALDGVVTAFLEGVSKGLNPNTIAFNASRALGIGLERITLIARTEQLRVNRLVSSEQYRNSGLDGYMRRVATKDDRVCMACLILDGQIVPLDSEVDDHPRGRCTQVFQIKGSPIIQWEKGIEWFKRQEPALQSQMMGAQKYELWQANQFKLQDIAKININKTWGNSPREASIQELTQ